MTKGYQAERDKVELNTIATEPGERAQTRSKVEQVSLEMSRDEPWRGM